jgi:hypothetical protein
MAVGPADHTWRFGALWCSDPIEQINTSTGQQFNVNRFQGDVTTKRRNQRLASPEQNGMDIGSDFVDEPGLEKRPSKIPAPHDADLAARPLLQGVDERDGVFLHKSDIGLRIFSKCS